jgi:hypothetical protein
VERTEKASCWRSFIAVFQGLARTGGGGDSGNLQATHRGASTSGPRRNSVCSTGAVAVARGPRVGVKDALHHVDESAAGLMTVCRPAQVSVLRKDTGGSAASS